jgi:hypothetical protein
MAATQSKPFMFWFAHSSCWDLAQIGRRMLHESAGSIRDTLLSLGILKRSDHQSSPTGLTMHDALASRGCVYLTIPKPPLRNFHPEFHRLPVVRLAGREIHQGGSWTVVESFPSGPVAWPEPDCFPTLGSPELPGWTQSAYFSSSCSVLIDSAALSSQESDRPRTGSPTWPTADTS